MTTFLISDMHFGDSSLTQANQKVGGKTRRPFADGKDMDAAILQRWNEVVGDDDLVWVLGDLGSGFKTKLGQVKGRKNLVAGNDDSLDEAMRSGVFEKIKIAEWISGGSLLLSHIPLHRSALGASFRNVHGHTHEKSVGDPRYICVSVDQIDYRPIALDEVVRRLDAAK
jgi:calcineurin-like phosphoesterase family protein